MAYFYRNGRLKVGSDSAHADVAELVRTSEGPTYIYDLDNIRERFIALQRSFGSARHAIHYAMKANSHPEVLRLLASLGAGVDTVSGGEIRRALECGFTADRIIFSGVGKTVREIEYALTKGIKQINVESPQELVRIQEIAGRLGRTADVAFRMNPDVNPKTHPYITTGFRENKFGMDESFLPELLEILSNAGSRLRLRGLTMHIGSQLLELDSLEEAIEKTVTVHRFLVDKGFHLDRLDIGGGLGIAYETDDESGEFSLMEAYGRMASDKTAGLGVELLTEPGRILVGRAGLLVGEVQYLKTTPTKTFAIINTGMHHLIRPALYGARHRVLAVRWPTDETSHRYDVVGPICESSDFLAKDAELPRLNQGDLLALADSGAYGFTMASTYNAHDLPREIAVSVGKIVSSSPAEP